MKAIAFLTVCALALAGCGGKDDMSKAQMAAAVDEALSSIEGDLGPGGTISGAELSIPVDLGDLVISLPLKLQVGTEGDLLITGSFGFPGSKVNVWASCTPEAFIVITDGIRNVDSSGEDMSYEMRNMRGTCTEFDPAVSELLGGFDGLGALLQNDGSLEEKRLKQTDKGTVEATYFDHSKGTEIVLLVVKGRLELVTATADEGELKVDFLYGQRQALEPLEPEERLPAPVAWSGKANKESYTLDILSGQAPREDVQIRVYAASASIPCKGGSAPIRTYELADGSSQNKDGIQMRFIDNGDGSVGQGDQVFFSQPAGSETWKYKVEVWDSWSDTSSHPACTIPGPGTVAVIGGLVLLGLVARRRV